MSCRLTLEFSSPSRNHERVPLHGTVEDIVGDVQAYSESGVQHIAMEIAGDSFGDKLRAMERFINEVKPHSPD